MGENYIIYCPFEISHYHVNNFSFYSAISILPSIGYGTYRPCMMAFMVQDLDLMNESENKYITMLRILCCSLNL